MAKTREQLQTQRNILVACFVVAVGFALLYGFGVIRFNIVSEYVVFIVLGALTSVLTYGILDSSGEISGTPYGVNVKLAGAIVPFVTVVAGGLYIWGHSRYFDLKVRFVGSDDQPVKVTGALTLQVGVLTPIANLDSTDGWTFDHLGHDFDGQDGTFSLRSDAFELTDPKQTYRIAAETLLNLHVNARGTFAGTVSFGGQRVAGAHLLVKGSSCEVTADATGYFSKPCAFKLPAHVEISVPEIYRKQICTAELPITALDGNALVLQPCEIPDAMPPVVDGGPRDSSIPLPTCGDGHAEAALKATLQATKPTQHISVTATLGPLGRLENATVGAGPPDLKAKVEGSKAMEPKPCSPVRVTATAEATQ